MTIKKQKKKKRFITSRISKSMKDRGFTEAFPSIYVPSVINRFIFGHCMLIYFIMQSLLEKEAKTYLVFLLSEKACSSPTYLFCQQPQPFLRKQILWNLLFVNTEIVFLAYPPGKVSVNSIGARKCNLTRGCKTTLVHDVSMTIFTF